MLSLPVILCIPSFQLYHVNWNTCMITMYSYVVFLSCKFGAIQNNMFWLVFLGIIKSVSSKIPIFTISTKKPVSQMFSQTEFPFILPIIQWFSAADTDPSQVSPVQQVRQPLGSVALDDALAQRLLAEIEHELCQLITRLLWWTEPPVHNVDTWIWERHGVW